MKKAFLRTAAALSAAVLFLMPCCAADAGRGECSAPEISAKSAVLIDADSGRVLYSKEPDVRSRIASTTKIMTGLLVCEMLPLERIVTVPGEAVGVEGSSMYLQAGEQCTVRELLCGLLLHSGNDAANALAILCDGSVERFAARMNARAKQLGMKDSHFRNPSGLDEDGHFSTARDLAVLARAAMQCDNFRQIAGTKSASFSARTFTNHNRLLWSYSGANGVKTGYTHAAGRVLVSSAERGGVRLIAVTINAPDDWNDHTALLDYGFSAFEHRVFLRCGEAVGQTAVLGGEKTQAALLSGGTLSYPLARGEKAELRIHAPQFVFAPVLPSAAGYTELLVDGQCVQKQLLYYGEPVAALPRKSLFRGLLGG